MLINDIHGTNIKAPGVFIDYYIYSFAYNIILLRVFGWFCIVRASVVLITMDLRSSDTSPYFCRPFLQS